LFTPISYKMDSVMFAIKGGTFLGVPKFEISFTFKDLRHLSLVGLGLGF